MSNIFVIPKFPTGSRLILDVSSLNKHLIIPHFKMTNHNYLKKVLQTPGWLATLDLSDAYLHVPIRKNLHKFLALTCWNMLFLFRALPFGLAPAPWLFTLLMDQALDVLRGEGIQTLSYIDDIILWNSDKAILEQQVQRTKNFLRELGLSINLQKSSPSPVSSLVWVGIVWDASKLTWAPQERLLQRIQDQACSLQSRKKCSRREWESLVGLIAFVGQINRRAKHLSHLSAKLDLFNQSVDRDVVVPIPQLLHDSLSHWVNVSAWVQPERFVPPRVSIQCWTDASKEAWGILGPNKESFQGRWTAKETENHINALELETILKAVSLLEVSNQTLVVWSDSEVSINVIQRLGSRSQELQRIMHNLLEEMLTRNIFIFPRHLRGKNNVAADALSRTHVIASEWQIPDLEFKRLELLHGIKLQIDLFASPLNHKLEKFVCPFSYPTAWGTDALSLDWNQFKTIYTSQVYVHICFTIKM